MSYDKTKKPDIELTDDQKEKILNLWNNNQDNPPSLPELVAVAFGGNFDGRSMQGKAVRSYLVSRNIKARKSYEYQPKGLAILTPEQKETIKNLCKTNKPYEIARIIFKDCNVGPLTTEARTVANEIKNLNYDIALYDPDDIPSKDYAPPKVFSKVLLKVNKYSTTKTE